MISSHNDLTCNCTETLYARELAHRSANMLQLAIAAVHLVRRAGPAHLDAAMTQLTGIADLNRLLARSCVILDLPSALRELGDAVQRSHDAIDVVVIAVHAEPLLVDAERARPLLMAVAELVGNSIRHGLKDGRGAVRVTVRDGGTWTEVTVEDTGMCGGWSRAGGQGRGIVDALLYRIDGTVERSITAAGSSRVTIFVPNLSAAARIPEGTA